MTSGACHRGGPPSWQSQAIALSHALHALACLPKAAVRDTQRTMPEESTTPDLVERLRALRDAVHRGDPNAAISLFAPSTD
jgi:hypothetical protein